MDKKAKQGAQYLGKSENAVDFKKGMEVRFERIGKNTRYERD
jgi:hypothetical protein